MAKLTGPLMSLGASGTIAKTITFGKWKGINTARQRVVPSNPNSAAQQAQRALMATVVAFWRGFLVGVDGKAAWNRDATSSGKAQSGFNAYTSSAVKIAAEVADASLVIGINDASVATVTFDVANVDDGATGDEAGNFSLLVGTSPTQMLTTIDVAIVLGELIYDLDVDFNAGDVVYAQVVKTAGALVAAKRSGIFQITLI